MQFLSYNLPKSHRIKTIINITPKMPLGPYPQPELYGQAGIAPRSNNINIITSIVPSMIFPFFCGCNYSCV